jgi:opacity protein-like surface antigen
MAMKQFICAAAVLIVFGLAEGVRADSPTTAPTTAESLSLRAPASQPAFLDPSRWRFEVLGTGISDMTNRKVEMGGGRIAWDYYTSPDFCLRCELTEYGVSTSGGNAAATQGSLGFRHHVGKVGDNSLFADLGFGVFDATRRVPQNGTYFNFTFHTGIGLERPLSDKVDLIAGIRYFHLSNARIDGASHNPSLNGPEVYIGLLFK